MHRFVGRGRQIYKHERHTDIDSMDTLMVKFVGLARQTQLPDVGVAEFVGPARQTAVLRGCVRKICRPSQTNLCEDGVCEEDLSAWPDKLIPGHCVWTICRPSQTNLCEEGCVKKICRPRQTDSSADSVCGRVDRAGRRTYEKKRE
jgi:hypothetical protein